jgi:hypothetical protein
VVCEVKFLLGKIYRVIIKSLYTYKPRYIHIPGTREMALVVNERGRMGVLCGTFFFWA